MADNAAPKTKAMPSDCSQGHALTGDNVSFTKKGQYYCRRCHLDRARRYYRKHRDKVLAYQADYYARNKEQILHKRKLRRLGKAADGDTN